MAANMYGFTLMYYYCTQLHVDLIPTITEVFSKLFRSCLLVEILTFKTVNPSSLKLMYLSIVLHLSVGPLGIYLVLET